MDKRKGAQRAKVTKCVSGKRYDRRVVVHHGIQTEWSTYVHQVENDGLKERERKREREADTEMLEQSVHCDQLRTYDTRYGYRIPNVTGRTLPMRRSQE